MMPDNIDTDALAPTPYLHLTKEEYSKHCLEDLFPDFASSVKPGDIILAGRNFGIGSSREQAQIALKHLGIRCVIAVSAAPLTKRNLFNIGVPIFEDPDIPRSCRSGEEAEITQDTFRNITMKWDSPLRPLPLFMMKIIEHGGLFPLLMEKGGLSAASTPFQEGYEIKVVGKMKIFPAYDKYVDTVVDLLEKGEVLCGPFDTTYGLFASIKRPEAVKRIYQLKRRGDQMPLTMIVPKERFSKYAQISDKVQSLLEEELDGPISIILKKKSNVVPDYVTSGLPTVSLANGENPFMKRVMERVELCGTSANIHGQPPPSTLSGVLDQLGEDLTLVVDGGPTFYRVGHTVLDLASDPPRIIRKGPYSSKKLFALFPELIGEKEEVMSDEMTKGRSVIDISPEVQIGASGTTT